MSLLPMAPTYPECDESDLRATMKALTDLKPVTLFRMNQSIFAPKM